jgi:predicted nucleic acid-binding protein
VRRAVDRFQQIGEVEGIRDTTGVEIEDNPSPALFLDGTAFREYQARGGTRTGVLPDFFIGAHAVVEGIGLLTRDARRYRTYFPTIRLIAPGDA